MVTFPEAKAKFVKNLLAAILTVMLLDRRNEQRRREVDNCAAKMLSYDVDVIIQQAATRLCLERSYGWNLSDAKDAAKARLPSLGR